MIDCAELIEGCRDCERQSAYLESIGHKCGPPDEFFRTWCEVNGAARRSSEEFHRVSHEPVRCVSCTAVLNDRLGNISEKVRPCASRCCNVWYCPVCNTEQCSTGPIGCPSCSQPDLTARVRRSRIRALYRRRRRYW